MTIRTFAALSVVVCSVAFAQEAPPVFVRDAVGVKSYAPAPRLGERSGVAPAVVLSAAIETMPEEIDAIEMWNRDGRSPAKNGFTREIPGGVPVRIGGVQSRAKGLGVMAVDHGAIIWSGAIQVKRAYRFRLHLTNVKLPDHATLWIYGVGEAPIGFGSELLSDDGSIYTPSVAGETAFIEVEAPAGTSASFDIHDVVELIAPRASSAKPLDQPTCLIDATCVTSATLAEIANFRKAVAHLEYVKNGSGFVCTARCSTISTPRHSSRIY